MRLVWVATLILALWGCQGAPGVRPLSPQGVEATGRSASLSIRIALPLTAQAIPANTQSIKVLLRKSGLADRTASVNTGAATSVTFSALPPGGGYTLYAASYAGLDGSGTMLSWGRLPLTLASGLNTASFGLSVVVGAGSGADDLVTGPAGNQAQQLGAQRTFTSMQDFSGGTPASVEVFYPGQFSYLGQFGSYGAGNGQLNYPDGIAVDALGNLYVADRFNHRVQKFDPRGTFLRAWGEGQSWTGAPPATASGALNGWFNEPIGVAIDPMGYVWVADSKNARVQKFDASGTFVMGVGSGTVWYAPTAAPTVVASASNGYFSNNLHDVVAGSDGSVYVADVSNYRVVKVGSNGQLLQGIGNGTTWSPPTAAPAPSASSGNGSFNGGHALALDDEGNLYVAETANNRIQKFGRTGSYLTQFPHSNTYGTLVAPFGRLLSSAPHTGATNGIDVLDQAGNVLSRFGSYGTGNGQFSNIRLMALAADGTLLVSDQGNSRIQRFKGLTPANLVDAQGGLRLVGHRQPDAPTFAGSGTYDTPAIDAGVATTWGSVYWSVASQPGGTGVTTAVATSSDGLSWGAWAQVAGSSAVGRNVTALDAFSSRYLRVRLTLVSTVPAASPEVQEVGVTY